MKLAFKTSLKQTVHIFMLNSFIDMIYIKEAVGINFGSYALDNAFIIEYRIMLVFRSAFSNFIDFTLKLN